MSGMIGRLAQAAAALQAAGVENARLEAQLLLGLALSVSRTAIVAGLHPEPTPEQWARFDALVTKRRERIPLAYLRGTQEFYGLEFVVTPAVLIPRPETELLVDFAREALSVKRQVLSVKSKTPVTDAQRATSNSQRSTLVDVGTGSGCIAIAVLANEVGARGVAIDRSASALNVAQTNAARNGVTERLRTLRGGLLSSARGERFNVIVSNPPYIPTGEIADLQAEVRDHEPRLALDGGADGLDLVRDLARDAIRALRPGGWLGVEIARGQAGDVAVIFDAAGLANVETRRDLAGIERVVCGQKAG